MQEPEPVPVPVPEPVPISLSQIASVFAPDRDPLLTPVKITDIARGSKGISFIESLARGIPTEGHGELKFSSFVGLPKLYQYPAKGMTSDVCVISGEKHGNGLYVASASSTVVVSVYKIFDSSDLENEGSWHSNNSYNVVTGIYNGDTVTLVDDEPVYGEWVQLQLPEPIKLFVYILVGRVQIGYQLEFSRRPSSFVMAGSNDGSIWTRVDQRQNFYYDTAKTTFVVENKNVGAFKYYRLIGQIMGNSDQSVHRQYFNFAELIFFGNPVNVSENMFNPRMWLRMEELINKGNHQDIKVWPSAIPSCPPAFAYKTGVCGYPYVVRPIGDNHGFLRLGLNIKSIHDGNWLDFGQQTFNISKTGMTAIYFVRFRHPAFLERLMQFDTYTDNYVIFGRYDNDSTLQVSMYGVRPTSINLNSSIKIVDGQWQLLVFRFDNQHVLAQDIRKFHRPISLTVEDRTFKRTLIGKSLDNYGAYANIDIKEVLVYDKTLTDGQIDFIRAYLYNKHHTIDKSLQCFLAADNGDITHNYSKTEYGNVQFVDGVHKNQKAIYIANSAAGGIANSYVIYKPLYLASTGNDLTLAYWIHPLSAPPAGQRFFASILRGFYSNSNGILLTYRNQEESHTGWLLRVWQGDSPLYTEIKQVKNPTEIVNVWTHHACTINGNVLTYYINGQTIGSVVLTNSNIVYGDLYLARHLMGSDGAFNGYICDLRLYKRALSKHEVNTLVDVDTIQLRHENTYLLDKTILEQSNVSIYNGNTNGKAVVVSGNPAGSTTSPATSFIKYSIPPIPMDQDLGLTLAFWVKLDQLPVLGKRCFLIHLDSIYILLDYSANAQQCYFQAGIETSPPYIIDASIGNILNVWSHFVLTIQGSIMTCYFNGMQKGVVATVTTPSINLQNMHLGSSNALLESVNATFDDIRVYSRALSAHDAYLLCNPVTFSHFGFDDTLNDVRNFYTVSKFAAISYSTDSIDSIDSASKGKSLVISGNTTTNIASYVKYKSSTLSTNAFTMCGWIKLTTPLGNGSRVSLLTMDHSTLNNDNVLNLLVNNNYVAHTGIRVTIHPSAVSSWTSGLAYPSVYSQPIDINSIINTWNHYAIVTTPTTISLYLNGQLQGSMTAVANVLNIDALSIPGAWVNNTNVNTNALYDDVMIFNRSLSANEINSIFASRSKIPITRVPYDDLLSCHISFNQSLLDERQLYLVNQESAYTFTPYTPFGSTGHSLELNGDINGSINHPFIEYKSFSPLTTKYGFTFSHWVYLKETPVSNNRCFSVVLKGEFAYANGFGIGYRNNTPSGTIGWYMFLRDTWDLEHSILWPLQPHHAKQKWTHLAGTINSETQTMTFFVDGVECGSIQLLNTDVKLQDMHIGRLAYDSNGHLHAGFNGYIKDVKIWTRALSPLEISKEAQKSAFISTKQYDNSLIASIGGQHNNDYGQVYPPLPMTNFTTTFKGLAYGNGSYVAKSSSVWTGAYDRLGPFRAFNKVLTGGMSGGTDIWASASNYSTNGLPTSLAPTTVATTIINSTTNSENIQGEWLQIKLPYAIFLHAYQLSYNINQWATAPIDYVLLASNNEIDWTIIDRQENLQWPQQQEVFHIKNATASYSIFRLITTKLRTHRIFMIADWELYALPMGNERFNALYPPVSLTGDSMTINNTQYGKGIYNVLGSSGLNPFQAFINNNVDANGNTNLWSSAPNYDATSGAYLGSDPASGEWIQIQLPYSVKPSVIALTCPCLAKSLLVCGSNDGSIWIPLYDTMDQTWTYEKAKLQIDAMCGFAYFRIIGRALSNGFTTFQAQNIQIIGIKENGPSEYPPTANGMTADTSVIEGLVYQTTTNGFHTGTLVNNSFKAFDKNETNTQFHSLYGYNSSTGIYYDTVSTLVDNLDIKGNWLQIQLPEQINLVYYAIMAASPTRIPDSFILAGSNDGIVWTQMDSRSSLRFDSNYQTFVPSNVTIKQRFQYFRFIFTVAGTVGGPDRTAVIIHELKLFGLPHNPLNQIDECGHYLPVMTKNITLNANLFNTKPKALTFSGNVIGSRPNAYMLFKGPTITTTNGYTIAMWVHPLAVLPANSKVVLAQMLGVFANNKASLTLAFTVTSGWQIAVQPSDGEVQVVDTNLTEYADLWTHLCATVSEKVLTFYVNGVQVGQNAALSDGNITLSNLCLGYNGFENETNSFNGKIDDVLIYKKALSIAEISDVAKLDDMQGALLNFDASNLSLGTVDVWPNDGTCGIICNATGAGINKPQCLVDDIGKYVYFDQSKCIIGKEGSALPSNISWVFDPMGTRGMSIVLVLGTSITSSGSFIAFGNSVDINTYTNSFDLYKSTTGSTIGSGLCFDYTNASLLGTPLRTSDDILNDRMNVYIVSVSATMMTLYMNRALVSTTPLTEPVRNRVTTHHYIGKENSLLDTKIRQLLVYNRPLSQYQVGKLTQQLQLKWGC